MSKVKILGDNLILKASFDGGSTYEAIGVASEHSLSINQDSIDAASKEDGVWNNSLAGNLGWTVSVSGIKAVDTDGNDTFSKIFGLQKNRSKIQLQLYRRTSDSIEAMEENSLYYYGEATIDSLEESASKGAIATFSASFTGAGELHESASADMAQLSINADADVVVVVKGIGGQHTIDAGSYVVLSVPINETYYWAAWGSDGATFGNGSVDVSASGVSIDVTVS